jgi:hypothetical protein
MAEWYGRDMCRTEGDFLYQRVLDHLWSLILHSEENTELVKRLYQECFEAKGMCCDGHINRLVNVMVGFHDAFNPPLSPKEILQNKMSNYDTDVFMPIFGAISAATGSAPYAGLLGAEDVDGRDMAYRVVGDHIRTLTFAITDGAVPSNEGRGYVLRRVLRRAVRYAQQVLRARVGFFSELVPVVVSTFSGAFPELTAKAAFVQDSIRDEEESFSRTLGKGI